jgi:hypothetical protein
MTKDQINITHTLVAWTLEPCKWTKGHWVKSTDLRGLGPSKTLCGLTVPLTPQVLFNREEGSYADHSSTCKRCLYQQLQASATSAGFRQPPEL